MKQLFQWLCVTTLPNCPFSSPLGTHQVEKVASYLADNPGERGSEELLNTGGPAAVHGVCLDVVNPLGKARGKLV